jgi:hypothetical protein
MQPESIRINMGHYIAMQAKKNYERDKDNIS